MNIKRKTTSCMCFADMEKAVDRVPRKVMEWAMRKKGSIRSNGSGSYELV